MNILFDLKTTQHFIGGGCEYIRKVFYTLIEDIKGDDGYKIYALYDSRVRNFAYPDLKPDYVKKFNVESIDIANNSLKNIIKDFNIDKVFMGCAQYWKTYDLENIKCPVVCVVHDLCDEELVANNIYDYVHLNKFIGYLRYKFHCYRKGNIKINIELNKKIFEMIRNNPYGELVTVSDYSKYSIQNNFNVDDSHIHVLYSPERITKLNDNIENQELRDLIDGGTPYYLMVSANRILKNADKAINAFLRYSDLTKTNVKFVTVGYPHIKGENHIILPYLSESDLGHAMKNCYAFIFPSFFEGFGYPPIEAMRYGRPILCSNVTSMPEVVSDAVIMFSPFYETDILKAFFQLNDENYSLYVNKSIERYSIVSKRQNEDLETLIKLIKK